MTILTRTKHFGMANRHSQISFDLQDKNFIWNRMASIIMADIEDLIDGLLEAEPNVYGVAIIDSNGNLKTQTDNWNIVNDVPALIPIIEGNNPGKVSIQGINYIIVEAEPERIIGTNVAKKGHIIIAPIKGKAALICFINPMAGPRDALFHVQDFTRKFEKFI